MKYQQLCDGIIAKVGGRDNVLDVSHCITRLRFHLKDESLAQTDELKAMKGVVDVIQAGGQYQVVIGATVESVYNELVQIGGFDAKPALDIDEGDNVKKGDPFSRLLAIISEILQPVLGVLMAGGFIKSMLALCTVAGWLAKDSNTYVTLSAIGDSVFYYFPLIIGWTAAKKFGLKPVMGMALGGILVYPTLVALMGGAGRSVPYEHRTGPGGPPRLRRPRPRLEGRNADLRRREREGHPRDSEACRSPRGRQDGPVRRPHRRAVR